MKPHWPDRDPDVLAAVAAVSRERLEASVRALADFPTRHTLSGARGADAAAAWLENAFVNAGGRLKVARQVWTEPAGSRIPAPARLTNVVAELPGTEFPDRWIVVSGHYDSRATDVMDARSPAPGANDDASGVAVVLECARILAERRLPTGIVFAAVTGEEQGLYGATKLAASLAERRQSVLAMATNDIVGNTRGQDGRRDTRRIRLFSAGYDPSETPAEIQRRRSRGLEGEAPSRTLARAIADAGRRYVRGFGVDLVLRNDRFGRGGDHTPFLQRGLAAVRFTEPYENWRRQHQDLRTEKGIDYGDLPDFVDYPYLSRVAQVNVAWLAELASAPPPPESVALRLDLAPTTTLSWPSVRGALGYEVLWRRTTAPTWTNSVRLLADSRPQITLRLSKDDHVFAVRAVADSGARGLPTVAGR